MMRFYLAARYSRRLELCQYRSALIAAGHDVKARWLDGKHQISNSGVPLGDRGERLVEGDDGSTDVRSAELRSKFAMDDFEDVVECDCLIAFTEPPRSEFSRGGRHVELGIALGLNKVVIVVGHRENIFCWLDEIKFVDTFERALELFESLTSHPDSP